MTFSSLGVIQANSSKESLSYSNVSIDSEGSVEHAPIKMISSEDNSLIDVVAISCF